MNTQIARYQYKDGTNVYIHTTFAPDWSWSDDISKTMREDIERGDVFQIDIEVRCYDKSGRIYGCDMLGGVVMDSAIPNKVEYWNTYIRDHEMDKNARKHMREILKDIMEKNK